MKLSVFFYSLMVLCVLLGQVVNAEEDMDFSAIKDPFVSNLPSKEIVKTSVETSRLNTDNSRTAAAVQVTPPVSKAEEPLPQFEIEGIVWGDEPMVLIEGQVYKVGTRVKSAKIVSIRKDGVEFNFKGMKFHVGIH